MKENEKEKINIQNNEKNIKSEEIDNTIINSAKFATNYTSSVAGGVRPVISIKPNTVIQGGFGTPEKPFVIETTE